MFYVRETMIRRSVDVVFAFCSDLRNELRWNPDARSVDLLSTGSLGVGTRFRAKWRGAPSTVVELVRFDPPRSWETTARSMGMEARTAGSVEPVDGGSRYRIRVELRPRGFTRLFAPLVLFTMRRQEGRNMARIRQAIEATTD
jgi:hypothetical protein